MLRYLARYVHRVAITDARVLAIADGGVTFSYKDARAHRWRRMTLPAEEFLRRFLQHVLPRGFHKVRYYGFWQPAARATRALLQQTLAPPRTDARNDPMPPRGDAGPHAGPHAGHTPAHAAPR